MWEKKTLITQDLVFYFIKREVYKIQSRRQSILHDFTISLYRRFDFKINKNKKNRERERIIKIHIFYHGHTHENH